MTQTLLRSNYKVSTTIRMFSHENFSKASFPILFPLLASGHSATKKIRKKQNKTKQNCLAVDAEQKGAALYPQPNAAVNKDGRNHSFIPKKFNKGSPSPGTVSSLPLHGAEVKIKLSYKLHLSPVNYFHSKNSCYVNPPISEKELHISKNSILILITQNNLGLESGVRGGNGWSGWVVVGETQLD